MSQDPNQRPGSTTPVDPRGAFHEHQPGGGALQHHPRPPRPGHSSGSVSHHSGHVNVSPDALKVLNAKRPPRRPPHQGG